MLTLYLAPGSSSMAAHIALHEVGVSFESRVVSFGKKDTRQADFLAINPAGQVPVLVVDGRVLTEVAAILFYLARKYPEAGLLPAGDLLAEAEAVAWMSFLAATVHPARRAGIEASRAIFGVVERKLGDREWAIGSYSIADIHLFRLFWRNLPSLAPKPGELPKLMGHYERMMARPAVIKTIAAESAMGYELP